MKRTPTETDIERLLGGIAPMGSARLDQRLSNAPWNIPTSLRHRLIVITAAAMVAFAALLVVTPQGRSLAQSALQFFTRAKSDTLPVQPFQLTPIPATTTPDPGYIFDKAIVEAGQEAGFDVHVPSYLPQFLSLDGASYEPDHNIVRIFYRYNQGASGLTDGLVLREQRFKITDECELCGLVGESSSVENVQIGDTIGEYIEGVWKLTDQGPVWEPDPYVKTVRWRLGDMAYELQYFGQEIKKLDLISIAGSLR